MAKRGRKDCSNCGTEIGARSHLCGHCGFHFPSGEVRKDLLKLKQTPVSSKKYTELGKGRKKCPGCGIIIGGVTKICPDCSFDFSTVVKEKVEKKEKKVDKSEYVSPTVQRLLSMPMYEAPEELSSKDHALRILSYGADRAMSLLEMAKIRKCWSHVDWDFVEKELV